MLRFDYKILFLASQIKTGLMFVLRRIEKAVKSH
jgi:hypothetical protein